MTQPKRILVAEDETLMRQTIQLFLEEKGYQVTAVADGQACMQELTKGPRPDALLLDVLMPQLGGLEVLERVRQTPDFGDLPTALLTAANQADVVRTALRLGVTDYVIKPFTKEALQGRVRDLTFKMTPEDLRAILPNLRQPDLTLFRAPGLAGLDANTLSIYPAIYEEQSLCVAMRAGIAPKVLTRESDLALVNAVQVFVKRMQVWRRMTM